MSKSQKQGQRNPGDNIYPDCLDSRIQFLSSTETLSVMIRDLPYRPSGIDVKSIWGKGFDHFFLLNHFQYYVAINLWCALINDIAGTTAALETLTRIKDMGLVKVIGLYDECADEYIAYIHDGSGKPNSMYFSLFSGVENPRDILTCLRFLKRFTVVEAWWLRDTTYEAFLDVLNKGNWRARARQEYLNGTNRDSDVTPPYCSKWGWLEEEVAAELAKMIPQATFESALERAGLKFSSGVCINAKTLSAKMMRYTSYRAGQPLFDWLPFFTIVETNGWSGKDTKFDDSVVVRAVPKNYKKFRTIAPEHSYNAAHMQRVQEALRKCLPKAYSTLFDVHSQDTNRRLAAQGSADGTYVTLDLSSASDSISRVLARRVLPPYVWSAIEEFLPRWVSIPEGKHEGFYTGSIFLTSGNPCTFELEARIFLAIVMVSRKLHWVWTHKWTAMPAVYGDDLVIPSDLLDEVVSLLSMLGFTINDSKSFANGTYRESCGIECYRGMDISGCYWPRKDIVALRRLSEADRQDKVLCNYADKFPIVVTQLCELQHKVYIHPTANLVIKSVIKRLYPRITESYIGSEYSDIWEHYPNSPKTHCAQGLEDAPSGYPPALVTPGYWDYSGKHKVLIKETNIVDAAEREQHTSLSQVYPVEAELTRNKALVELYYYYDFLARGPEYDDELSRLLRVSSPRRVEAGVTAPSLRLSRVTS